MDQKTISAYNRNAKAFFNKYSGYQDGVSKYFNYVFPENCRILDIGSGSGKDLSILQELGHDVTGIEPSTKLAELCVSWFPLLSGKIKTDSLPELFSLQEGEMFDGIICSAVFMHLPEIQLFDSALSIKKHLKPEGRLLVSIPFLYPDIIQKDSRDSQGRLYNGITPGQIILLFERLGLRLLEKWEDLIRESMREIKWVTLLFTSEYGNNYRPIDSIETIINRDKKVATYKLALFRALAEIAARNINAVKWCDDGKVRLPIVFVREKWIEYYWSLFEHKTFIPQIQNERSACAKPVAFRSLLEELISIYKSAGGYEGYIVDKRRLKLNLSSLAINNRLEDRIDSTIVNGPVKYAGGYGSSNKLLDFDRRTRTILIPESIWKELTILGNWIADASILRWAELTSRFSKGIIRPSLVVDLLLTEERSRQIDDARKIFRELNDLRCVWSYAAIQEFDVDHIIPFSLWKNNDLWNLMPAKPSINKDKSDKLVTADHLKKSKDLIIDYWKLYISREEDRFFNEAAILSGLRYDRKNWEIQIFSRLNEAVEYTAIQRGTSRWSLKM
jgi:SAM-dependent methyltransferase